MFIALPQVMENHLLTNPSPAVKAFIITVDYMFNSRPMQHFSTKPKVEEKIWHWKTENWQKCIDTSPKS